MEERKTFRLTLDLDFVDHKRLKAWAAARGKPMRDIVVDALKSYYSNQLEEADEEIIEMAERIMDKYDPVFKKLSNS